MALLRHCFRFNVEFWVGGHSLALIELQSNWIGPMILMHLLLSFPQRYHVKYSHKALPGASLGIPHAKTLFFGRLICPDGNRKSGGIGVGEMGLWFRERPALSSNVHRRGRKAPFRSARGTGRNIVVCPHQCSEEGLPVTDSIMAVTVPASVKARSRFYKWARQSN